MGYKKVWEFSKDEKVLDLVSSRPAKVLVLNSNNSKVERRFYIEVVGEDGIINHYWRIASQLGKL
jgi:hypothetical protein